MVGELYLSKAVLFLKCVQPRTDTLNRIEALAYFFSPSQ